MSGHFTPTLHQVLEASRKLPDASVWPEKEIAVAIPVSGKSQLVHFEKLRKNRSSSASPVRWIYNGEAIVSR
jgi:hypothetical protein